MPTPTLGAHALGTEPLAGDPLHDPPVVVIDTIGTVSTGGPVLTITWQYTQPQNDAQDQFRVQLWNDALSVMYYDSGWIVGADETYGINIDVAEAPHQSTDITARVLVQSRGNVAEDTDAFIIQWGVPHCTITAPTEGTVFIDLDAGINTTWTFTDDIGGKTQSAYRVRLLLATSGIELWDTGWVVSAATSFLIPVALTDESQYSVEVQLKNNHGIRSD